MQRARTARRAEARRAAKERVAVQNQVSIAEKSIADWLAVLGTRTQTAAAASSIANSIEPIAFYVFPDFGMLSTGHKNNIAGIAACCPYAGRTGTKIRWTHNVKDALEELKILAGVLAHVYGRNVYDAGTALFVLPLAPPSHVEVIPAQHMIHFVFGHKFCEMSLFHEKLEKATTSELVALADHLRSTWGDKNAMHSKLEHRRVAPAHAPATTEDRVYSTSASSSSSSQAQAHVPAHADASPEPPERPVAPPPTSTMSTEAGPDADELPFDFEMLDDPPM